MSELIKELFGSMEGWKPVNEEDWGLLGNNIIFYERLAKWVEEDRRRIVQPLVNALEESSEASDTFEEHDIVHRGIEETLKLAGLNKG